MMAQVLSLPPHPHFLLFLIHTLQFLPIILQSRTVRHNPIFLNGVTAILGNSEKAGLHLPVVCMIVGKTHFYGYQSPLANTVPREKVQPPGKHVRGGVLRSHVDSTFLPKQEKSWLLSLPVGVVGQGKNQHAWERTLEDETTPVDPSLQKL